MPPTLLYIDDDARWVQEIEPTLQRAGFDFVHAGDPREALRAARARPPAIVLIEVLLGGHDGYALVEQLMSEAAPRPLPVLVVTRGDRTPKLYGRGLELGVEDFLCKPVTCAQVLEAVLDCASCLEAGDAGAEGRVDVRVEADPSFGGELGEQLLPDLLGRLHRAGASGVLMLRDGAKSGALELRNGTPVQISLEQDAESVAIYLRKTGRIDGEQYEMLLDHLMARLAGPREILLGMGALGEAELRAAANEQALGILYGLCGWASGSFRFDAGATLDAADALELASRPDEVIVNTAKRADASAIGRVMRSQSDCYVFLATDPSDRLAGVDLTTTERKALFALAGDRTLAEILEATALDESALYRLLVSGRIELDHAPVLVLHEALETIEEEEIALDIDPEDALMAPDLSRHRSGRGLPRRRVVDDGSTEAAIQAIAERLEARDDFALFEIDETSSNSDVRAAYDRMLSVLSVERIPEELAELRASTRELLSKLDQAYGRVKNADARAAFAGLRRRRPEGAEKPAARAGTEESSPGERAREAESWFRTGEGHLAHKEYSEAVEAFGMAVHRDPSQGDYHAHLGYALYRSNPDQEILRREALEHVAKGVKLSPGRDKPLLFLARIFRESGESATATKVLRRALKLSPDNPALVQEMCLIQGTSKRSNRRFLERFRRR